MKVTQLVAPLAGAWIETMEQLSSIDSPRVAPLAGAWIETILRHRLEKPREVAPLAGAWIETSYEKGIMKTVAGSHPSRVRGLKPRS